MTIAYIKSNAKRRTLLVLVVLGLWLVLPLQAVVAFWKGGWREAKWRVQAELTQGGEGFWRSVAECWHAPAPKLNAAQRMVGLHNPLLTDSHENQNPHEKNIR